MVFGSLKVLSLRPKQPAMTYICLLQILPLKLWDDLRVLMNEWCPLRIRSGLSTWSGNGCMEAKGFSGISQTLKGVY